MNRLRPHELADVIFWMVEGVYALKALLCFGNDESPHHWSVLRAIHTLNSPQNYIGLLGGLWLIHTLRRRRGKGLIRGTRGPLLPAAVMVSYGCVG
jgi:hypothetical protein